MRDKERILRILHRQKKALEDDRQALEEQGQRIATAIEVVSGIPDEETDGRTDRTEAREKVLAAVRESEGVSRAELVRSLEEPTGVIDHSLRQLVRGGEIIRTGRTYHSVKQIALD